MAGGAEGDADAGFLEGAEDIVTMAWAVHPACEGCSEMVGDVVAVGDVFAEGFEGGDEGEGVGAVVEALVAKRDLFIGHVLAMGAGGEGEGFPRAEGGEAMSSSFAIDGLDEMVLHGRDVGGGGVGGVKGREGEEAKDEKFGCHVGNDGFWLDS